MSIKEKFLLLFIAIISFHEATSTITLIDTPGVFPLGGSIIIDPQLPQETIVTIRSSNVVFDINGFVLSQNPLNETTGTIGIHIEPHLKNITIKNGTIIGLSGTGITVGEGCDNIYLENLSILDCNDSGIVFEGNPAGNLVQEIMISDCLVSSCGLLNQEKACGMRFIATKHGIISNSIFSNNGTVSAQEGHGIFLDGCYNCDFIDCKSYNNGGSNRASGFTLINSNACSFIDCIANANAAHSLLESTSSCGFLVKDSKASFFKNCKLFDNSHSRGHSFGFNSQNNSSLLIENCHATHNNGGIFSAGYYFDSQDLNCKFNNNICSSNTAKIGKAYGILVDGAQNFLIHNNTTIGNRGAQGYGLVDTTINTNNLITNNVAYNNSTGEYSVVFTQGNFPVQSVYNNDFSSLNSINHYYNIAFAVN